MNTARVLRPFVLALCFSLMAVCAFAQAQPENKEYHPEVGQYGKDVVWVPTAQALAEKMLTIAQAKPQDYVIDLGSGDGRLVITAAKLGARALGIEYNPDLVALSRRNAAREGVAERAQFIQADLFETDFSKATVITMFLLPELNMRLRPAILKLKPGTRVVSTSFHMEDWTPDQTFTVTAQEGCNGPYCEAHLWIVPANVEGTWRLPDGELALKQSFQMVSGTLKSGAAATPIRDGKLNGDKISFATGDGQYSGVINGNTIQGILKTGTTAKTWSAIR